MCGASVDGQENNDVQEGKVFDEVSPFYRRCRRHLALWSRLEVLIFHLGLMESLHDKKGFVRKSMKACWLTKVKAHNQLDYHIDRMATDFYLHVCSAQSEK